MMMNIPPGWVCAQLNDLGKASAHFHDKELGPHSWPFHHRLNTCLSTRICRGSQTPAHLSDHRRVHSYAQSV